MNKRKKSNINALTNIIQNSNMSYAQFGKELKKYISKLGLPCPSWYTHQYDNDLYCELRISKLAQGVLPTAEELKALALWKLGDAEKWPYLYFPNEKEGYKFTYKILTKEINNIFATNKNIKQLDKKLNNYTKFNIRNGINHRKVSATELTSVFLGLLDLKQKDEINLGLTKEKLNLKDYANQWLIHNLKVDSPLIKQITIQLRNTLELEHSKKRELKQVVLRQLISVL